ncbi:flavin monoamine oxidase family protein [Flavihumibacter profundi]|uniref:flavin monoamine oxidase family protein n=1 Tax=Flavihumibacter profundi TaxID=2716883 RepID=UPI001CC3A8FD|nr:NAD(P)/FAD-dependent oxidoreductase [Flavihumibacter profundi]MBZ5858824.1 FAD-dependent oxidoreductase [Flavihumibacter profundi]
MAHYPLIELLKRAFINSLDQDGITAGEFQAWQKSRRHFLKQTAVVAGGMAFLPSCLQADQKPRVAIIGAGIAGLNAAWQLRKNGILADVYEASNRTGGRMWSLNEVFGKEIYSDLGGEFVDTSHADIIKLVEELGLSFLDLRTDPFVKQTYYFDGKVFSEEDLVKALTPYVKQMVKDITSLPEHISYRTAPDFQRLDDMSISEYLQSIGISGWLYNYLNVLLTREYGMEITEQSAINFLIMFQAPSNDTGKYSLFGEDHEVFRIKGGAMHLTDTLYNKMPEQIKFSHRLTAINSGSDGKSYELEFFTGGKNQTITADYVISTIPFTILRNIPMKVNMPAGKRKCIDELGYGNSCKLILGMDKKPWRDQKMQGYTFTDISFGCGWDSSNLQSEREGSFTVFGGGRFSDMVSDTPMKELEINFSGGLDTIYPGAKKAYNGKNIKYCWAGNPFSKAGYSAMKKGQWSTLAGWEAEPVGNIFFAGEQVSLEFQGYMNGAAKTAAIAAEAVMKKIKSKTS